MGTNDYLCQMNGLEFLIKYKDGLSLSGIEEKLVIPTNTLKRAIKTGNLPSKHDKKIAEWFELEVPVERTTHNPKESPTRELPNLKRDGSFDMSYWEVIAIKMCHKTESHMVKYEKTDKKYYPRD